MADIVIRVLTPACLALLLFAAPQLELPTGKPIELDGKIEKGEWDDAFLQLIGVEDAVGDAGEDLTTAEDQLAVVAAVTDSVAERIFAVARVEGRLELWMAPAGLVLFGSATQIEEKFLALDTVFAQVDDRCMAVLDVRIPQTPTLNRIPACANPEPVESPDVTGVNGITVPD